MDGSLWKEIWPIFAEEARERVRDLSAGLRALEHAPEERPPDLLEEVRRAAHSIKGSAASVGLEDMSRLAHALESAIAALGPRDVLAPHALEAALAAVDVFEETVARADAGGSHAIPGLDALCGALATGGAMPVARPAPPAAPPNALRASVDALMDALPALRRPSPPDEKQAAAEAASAQARSLLEAVKAQGAPKLAAHAEALLAALAEVTVPDKAPHALSAMAEALVALDDGLAAPPAPLPAREEPAARQAREERDAAVKVTAGALDSLGQHLDELATAQGRRDKRTRSYSRIAAELRELTMAAERKAAGLRAAGRADGGDAIGELSNRLRTIERELTRVGTEGRRDAEQARINLTALRTELRDLRLVPAALLVEPVRRAVRELTGKLRKDAALEVVGAEVRVDRKILDGLREPLLQLVRNAMDHGLEPNGERAANGKPGQGRLELRVERRGHRVAVSVHDDGRGLDVAEIRTQAVRQGLLSVSAAAALSDRDAMALVLQPGFSTAKQVTETSGRGVGLDIVQQAVTKLGGSLLISSEPGLGTTFTLDLPLTLAATLALEVRVGEQRVAIPTDAVTRVLRLDPAKVTSLAGRAVAKIGDEELPFATLASLVGVQVEARADDGSLPTVVLSAGGRRAALAVTSVEGQHESVLQLLGEPLESAPHLAGAVTLDDGSVVAMADPAVLLARVAGARLEAAGPEETRILVVDDSVTTRMTMKSLLELAGYRVTAAVDGEDALRVLARVPCKLVVTDVEMPRMNGLDLTRRIKGDPRLAQLPVVVVTSLDTDHDRAAGLAAGADGYLVKRDVETGALLDLVRQLVPEGE